MSFLSLTGLFLLASFTGLNAVQLKVSRFADTWQTARAGCQAFGGHLATLKNLEAFRHAMYANTTDVIIEDGTELWVGGVLVDLGWIWVGSDGNPGNTTDGLDSVIAYRGCFKQAYWTGAHSTPGVTAEGCLNTCRWQGAVGLKKDYCICERDLRNVTRVEPGLCHFSCAGNQAETCGGLFAVSIYQTTSRTISWAADEPKSNNDCVYIRRQSPGSPLEWVTSNCDLQTRFLCRFEDDDKFCGLSASCIRWATQHATWVQAKRKCEALNGHLAEIDNIQAAALGERLPPGTFWIALKRERLWRWTDGTEIPTSNFYGHERHINPEEACAVIHNIRGSFGFSARSCLLQRNYLCQYDYMQSPNLRRADQPPKEGSPSIQPTYVKNVTEPDADVIKSGADVDIESTELDGLPKAEPSGLLDDDSLVTTCIYVVVGFICGVAFILLTGLALYCCVRYCGPQSRDKKGGAQGNRGQGRVSYSADRDSVKMTVGQEGDGIYDTVYDLQTESPFRRTQRLIRMGSATNFRHASARRPNSDLSDSSDSISKYTHGNPQRQRSDVSDNSSYLWRGEVGGGKIEVINTELRELHPGPRHDRFDDVSYVVHNQARCKPILKDAHPGLRHSQNARLPMDDEISEYEFATSETYRPFSMPNSNVESRRISYEENAYPTFVEMERKLSELANEENLYASIKKTFPKNKPVQTTNLDSSDDDVIY